MPRRRRERLPAPRIASLGALASIVLIAPELMGGSTSATALAIAIAAPAAILTASWAFARHAPSPREPLVVAGVAAALLCAAQALPLPIAVVDAWYPDAAEGPRAAAVLLDEQQPSTASISIAPIETRREIAEGLAVLCVLLAAWCASASGDRAWVVRIAAASVVLLACVVLAHAVLDLRQPFGFLPAPEWNPPFVGPLLNANHLAGVLGAGVPLLLAVGLDVRDGRARSVAFVAAAIVSVLCVLCGSRGGILSLGIGVLAFVFVMGVRRSRQDRARTRSTLLAALGLTVIAAVVTAVVVGDAMIEETRRGLPKIALFMQSLDVIPDAPWTGVGRGGYEAAFVRLHGGITRPEHPENLVIEWAIELGPPVALLVIAACAAALVRAARAARSIPQMGAIAAAVSFAVHDQLDFALEIPGTGVLAACVLGAAVAPSSEGKPEGSRHGARLMIALGLAALGVAIGVAEPVYAADASRLQDRMLGAIRARDWATFDSLARTAVRAHPAEPAFALLAGHAALVRDDPRALRWLTRAMVLAPDWYEPHHLAARWLARHGAVEQAWLELREMRRLAGPRAGAAACSIASRPGASSIALRVFADDPELLEILVGCAPSSDAAEIDDALAERGLTAPLVRQARQALERGDIEAALEVLARIETDSDAAAIARADVLARAGRHSDAVRTLEDRARVSVTVEIVQRLALAQADARDEASMRETAARLLTIGDGSSAALARQRLFLADLEQRVGATARAFRALDDAHGFDPSGPALARILALAEATGDGRRAHLARLEICRRDGPTSPHCGAGERAPDPAQLPTLP